MGTSFTWWARVNVGRFWSSAITLKEGHQIIETGPYGLVRHPIYAGLIGAILATGTASATVGVRSALRKFSLAARPIHTIIGGTYQENFESHPGERFNTLNKPAKPSGRGQGLRSTGSLARSTFLLFFDSWPLMRRPGDTATTFLALGSCECRLTIFGVAGGLRGWGGVSSGAVPTGMTGSAAGGSRTHAISSLSAFVNVSCEEPIPMVVLSGDASTIGGGVRVPALISCEEPVPMVVLSGDISTIGGGVGVPAQIATIAPKPLKQRAASHIVLVTTNPAWSEYAN